jgi:hypothetical protein
MAGTDAVAGEAAVTGAPAVTAVAVGGAGVTLVVDAAPHPGTDTATKAPATIQRPTRHVRERPAGQGMMMTANAGGLHRSLNILLAFLPHRQGTYALIIGRCHYRFATVPVTVPTTPKPLMAAPLRSTAASGFHAGMTVV